MGWLRKALVLGLGLAGAVAGAEEWRSEPIVLIVSAEWAGPDAIDLPTLQRVYLDRQTHVAGTRTRALHLPAGSPIRAAFSRTALGRSEASLERYWIQQALLGGGLPPREVASAAAVLRRVRSEPGTIGYVALSQLKHLDATGIRTLPLTVDGRTLQAGEPGYPLRFRAPAAGP